MPYLVRWDSAEGKVTLRCEVVMKSTLVEGHLTAAGVRGLKDPDHPDLEIHTISLRSEDVVYITEALAIKPIKKAKPPDVPPAVEAPKVSDDANAPTNQKKQKSKSKKSRWA